MASCSFGNKIDGLFISLAALTMAGSAYEIQMTDIIPEKLMIDPFILSRDISCRLPEIPISPISGARMASLNADLSHL